MLTAQRLREQERARPVRAAPSLIPYSEHQSALAELHESYGRKLADKDRELAGKDAEIAVLTARLAKRDERIARVVAERSEAAKPKPAKAKAKR